MHASCSKHFNNIVLILFVLVSWNHTVLHHFCHPFVIIVLSYILYTLIHSHVIWIHYFLSLQEKQKKTGLQIYLCMHTFIHTYICVSLSQLPTIRWPTFIQDFSVHIVVNHYIDWHMMPRESVDERTIFSSIILIEKLINNMICWYIVDFLRFKLMLCLR